MRVAFNLTLASEELKKVPRYKDLVRSINLYFAVCSFLLDLEQCSYALETLQQIEKEGARQRGFLGGPLMTHAVTFYCRAAIEDGNGRFKIGVTKHFTPEQKEKNRDIVLFRNKTLAHYDKGGGRYFDDWLEEYVILRFNAGRMIPENVYKRANYMGQFVYDLSELCYVATNTCKSEKATREKALFEQIKLVESPDLTAILDQYVFDPVKFFPGMTDIDEYWEGAAMRHERFQPLAFGENAVAQKVGDIQVTKFT